MLSQNLKEKTFGGLRQIVVAAFAAVCAVILLDELLDLPHLLFGTPATPFNWTEAVVECVLVALIGWLCVHLLSRSESRRRQAEEALAAEKERLGVSLRSIGDGVIATDVEGSITLMNQTAESLTGWTQGEALGKPLSQVFHIINEKTRKCCENPVEKVFETGGIVGLANDTVLVARDGTERVVADSGAPIRDEQGEVIGVILVFRDMTEQRRAQQALRETRNYLENLLDHANAPIIVWDTGSKITKFNHAFEHLTGYAAEEVIGQELRILFPEASRDESLRRIERTLSGEYWESVEIPILRKDGDTRIALWNSANIYIEDGKTLLATIAQGQDITDRKHAEEALRESEEKVRLMVSEVKDYAIFMLDPEGRISSWNEGAQHIKGYSSEEILGEHFSRFYTKEDVAAGKPDEELKEAIARGRFEDEGWRVRKDGSRFFANVVITALRDEAGELKGFTKVTRDITERKQVEEKVKAQKKFTDNIINSLADTIYIIDPKSGKGIYWNETLNKISGYNYKQMNEYPPSHFYPPEEHKLIEEVVETTLKKGRGSVELNYIIADGSRIPFEYKLVLIKDAEGKPCICAVGRDLREQKQAEEALASSEEFLNSIIEQSPVSLWISDSEGTLIRMNQSCRELFGATDEEAVGKYNLFKDNLIEEQGFIPLVENVFEKGEIARFTIDYDLPGVEHVKVNGATHRILDVIVSPIKDMHGKVTNAIVQHKDITEIKQAEEELEKHRHHLEELVEERTTELQEAQERLVSSEKLAVLGQLAGGVGHELRNPLGAIKNAAYFLNMAIEEPEPEVKETLEILDREVATSERIISSLLGFARPKPPSLRKVDINNLVRETLPRVAVPENVEVATELQSLPAILADPDQLGQVFGNILSNGIQAMSQGGRLVIKSGTRDPGWVTVSIIDTGVGMPEEVKSKVFEPLFTTKAKGIGLGLAVSRTLVEGNGGTIEVESEVGKGSTFTLRLPIGGEERELHE